MKRPYKIRTFFNCFALVCFVLLNDQEEFRAMAVLSSYWGFFPRPKHSLFQLSCGTGKRCEGWMTRCQIRAPPKASSLLALPQPESGFHPQLFKQEELLHHSSTQFSTDTATEDTEGNGSCEAHQHNSNLKWNQQANKWAVILSGGNRNQRSCKFAAAETPLFK